jgi:hypothetical protein
MCGRYELNQSPAKLKKHFETTNELDLKPRFNIAPTQTAPIVALDETGSRVFTLARWGLIPSWVKDPDEVQHPINAKAETAAIKPMFRHAYRKSRVLIPADGFYEWMPKNGKQPASATSSLVVAKVDAAASPAIAVVTDNTGKEKIALIGTKDSSGAPLSLTQGVYISASGEAGTITMGADGLPASLSDAVGDKSTFTNFTDNTMDITQFDPAGNKVAGPVTVNVDPTILSKLRADAGTLASSSTQGTSLVTGVILGATTQDWVDIGVNFIGTAAGLFGCVDIAGVAAEDVAATCLATLPACEAELSAMVSLGRAMCVSTGVKAASDITGTNRPTYITVADAGTGIAADCVLSISIAKCVADVVGFIVKPIANANASPPTTPIGLTLLKVKENEVIFRWTESTDDFARLTAYSVYRDGSKIDDDWGTSYVDTNVIPGQQYGYTVVANDENGKSSLESDPLYVTIPVATLFVSATTPVSGTSGALVSNPVFATFNEAIDSSTLNASTFAVSGPGGLVAGTVSYNAVTQSAVFTPSENLAYATTYTATVTTGLKDLSGNPLASNYSWNLTTASNIGGGTAPLSFSVLNPSSVSTSAVGYQPTLTASGTNFSNLKQIRFDWSGVTSGSATWIKGTASWNPSKITVYSDSLMTLMPVVTQTGDPTGATTWSVTLTDFAGTTVTKTFTVNYTPTGTITCTPPQVLNNGVCVTPTANTFSISGSAGLQGVTMTLSGASSAGATSDANGNYTFGNLANGTYTIAPALSGYTFTPSSLVITVSGANITAANFTATSQSGTLYSITGTVTASGLLLPGVTMTLSGANSGAYTTGTNGMYGFALLANGSYTVTPTLSGYTFNPASSVITISGANIMGANFTGSALPTAPTLSSISPNVITQGAGYTNVTFTGTGFTASSWPYFTTSLGASQYATSAPTINNSNSMTVAVNNQTVQTITWKVCAANGSSTCSGTQTVTVQPAAVSIPATPTGATTAGVVGTSSGPGPVTPSSTVNMSWNTSSGAVNYNLIVMDVTSNTQAVNYTLSGNTYTTALTAGHQYNWKVAACNTSGCSAYTAAQYFQTPSSTPPLSITTTSLPSATVGTGYAQGVSVSGGQTPYTWSVSSGLPSGLNINSTTGAIYGTPSVSGTFYFTVTAYDSSSPQKTASQALSLSVSNAVVTLMVNGVASNYTATSGTYQPTIALSGSGFSSVVNQIYFTCAKNGVSCGNYTWTSANWSGKYIVYSDTSAVIAPVLTVSSDPSGTYNWSVTFSGAGQSATKYFTVTK